MHNLTLQQTRLSGLWLPLITPFRNGQIDSASFRRLIEHYLHQPIDGLIVAATTGEGLTLSDEETAELVTVAAQVVNGRVPLHLGLSGSDTARLTTTLEATASWPVDGYLISCPYYSRPSQRGLHDHFAALAQATVRPLVLYNIPYRTGVNLSNDTLLELAEIPNIIGLKDCCAIPAQTFDLLRRKSEALSVMTGEDLQLYNALVHGADGAILASAHIETGAFAQVQRQIVAGEQTAALQTWSGLVDLVQLLFSEPSPAAIKHWLWRAGLIDSPELRLPMTGISPELATRIDDEMAVRQELHTAAAQ